MTRPRAHRLVCGSWWDMHHEWRKKIINCHSLTMASLVSKDSSAHVSFHVLFSYTCVLHTLGKRGVLSASGSSLHSVATGPPYPSLRHSRVASGSPKEFSRACEPIAIYWRVDPAGPGDVPLPSSVNLHKACRASRASK